MANPRPIYACQRPILPGASPFLFGILNCTPDSFSDGGKHVRLADAIAAGEAMATAGADVIDVGGESTRPGSQPISAAEQIARTAEVIATLARTFGAEGPAISIDTRSAEVARAAIDAGATIVNDVSALREDAGMADVVARSGAGVILMHMQGTPATMQLAPHYDDVIVEILAFLGERMSRAVAAGIAAERIILDPGVGFGKTTAHNLEILRHVGRFAELGCPVMVGTSRKRFTTQLAGDGAEGRLWGTLATVASCTLAGVECLRVHDVAACRAVARSCAQIRGATG